MDPDVERRKCLVVLGGAVLWPLAARAQQDGRVRRIGILTRGVETAPVVQAQLGAVREGLAQRGWTEGRNVRFDIRLYDDDPDLLRAHAQELVRLAPDCIVAGSRPSTLALLQLTRDIPIVFHNVGDPTEGGILKNIARPEGNATGATSLYHSIAGKWLELLKEAAPHTSRVALIFVPGIVGEAYFPVIDAAAAALSMKVVRTPYRNGAELERAIDAFAAEPNGALVIVPPPPRGVARELINQLALKHRLPGIGANDYDSVDTIMMSYGSDSIEPVRIAASYVDRILRGAKVSELPVQFPSKFGLVINLKTAKAIGLDIPATLTARADELIQ
jgi:putative tryptophan/tyrosine transport system substrate-binding protein